MRITKKVVSIVLAVMMVAAMMSVMAVSASATETGTPISTSAELSSACQTGGEYYLTQDINMLHYYYLVRNNVTIHGNGYKIKAFNNGSVNSYYVFAWYDNSHASLTIDNVTLDGSDAAHCAVYTMCSSNPSVCPDNNDNADCKVTMTNCAVQNFKGFEYVGAVYIFAYSQGEFNNCTFTNNSTPDTSSPYQGSDIWAGGGTKLTINGGSYAGSVYGNASGSVASVIKIDGAEVEKVTLGATSQAGADVTVVNSTVNTLSVQNNDKSDVSADGESTLANVVDFENNNVKEETVKNNVIKTAAALADAAAAGGNWVLGADIELSEAIVIPASSDLTLNLNGYDIFGYVDAKMLQNYGTLTINDTASAPGHVYNTCIDKGQGRDAVTNYGTITINNGYFGDSDSDMTNGNNYNRGAGLRNLGTGVATVNGGYFTAGDNFLNGGWAYAIINGSDNDNPTITINYATVYGKNNGNVANNSGSVTVNGGNYTLDGSKSHYCFYVYNGEIEVDNVTVNKSGNEKAVAFIEVDEDNPNDAHSIDILGGDFSYTGTKFAGTSKDSVDDQIQVSGGTFTGDVDRFAAPGLIGEKKADGTYGVVEDTNPLNGKVEVEGYEKKITSVLEGNDIGTQGVRILTKVNDNFLSDESVTDYGYVVAKYTGTKALSQLDFSKLTTAADNGQKKISCKGSANTVKGSDYVTLAVNGMTSTNKVVARFYVVKNGVTYYSYYISTARYNGILAAY